MLSGYTEELRLQEKTLLKDFNQRERQEEVYWNQKSRIKWLQEGECNTSFFHKETIQHRQGNKMDRLKKEDGSIVESQEDLETTLNSYFAKLLQEPKRDIEGSSKRGVKSHSQNHHGGS